MARGEGRGASGAAMEPCGPNVGAEGEARTGATSWKGGGGPCSAGLFPCSSAKTSLFPAREMWRRHRPQSHARSAWCPDFAQIAALVARQGSVRLDPEVGAPAKLGHRLLGRDLAAGVGDVEQARRAEERRKPSADDAGRACQEYPAHETPSASAHRAFMPADICSANRSSAARLLRPPPDRSAASCRCGNRGWRFCRCDPRAERPPQRGRRRRPASRW